MELTQIASRYYGQAYLELEQRQDDLAEQHLLCTIACDEAHADAWVLLGLLHLQRGEITDGVHLLQTAAEHYRDRLSDDIPLDEYIQRYRPMVQQDKTFRSYYNQALSLVNGKSAWADAAELLRQGLAVAGDHDGWLLLALCYIQTKETGKAREALLRAKQLSPTDPRIIRYEQCIGRTTNHVSWFKKFINLFRKE